MLIPTIIMVLNLNMVATPQSVEYTSPSSFLQSILKPNLLPLAHVFLFLNPSSTEDSVRFSSWKKAQLWNWDASSTTLTTFQQHLPVTLPHHPPHRTVRPNRPNQKPKTPPPPTTTTTMPPTPHDTTTHDA